MPREPRPRLSPADWCAALLLGGAVALTVWQIAARQAGRLVADPLGLLNVSYTEELVRYVFIWVMLVGTVSAVGWGEHLHVRVLTGRISPRVDRCLAVGRRLAWTTAGAVLLLGGARVAILQLRTGQSTAALGWPIVWVALAVPACGGGLLWAAWRAKRPAP